MESDEEYLRICKQLGIDPKNDYSIHILYNGKFFVVRTGKCQWELMTPKGELLCIETSAKEARRIARLLL